MAKAYLGGGAKQGGEDEQECWGFGKERSKWSQARAIFISKPTEELEGELGSVIYAPIEVQNQTKWPWKKGCFIGLLDRQAQLKGTSQLIVGDIPIDQEVRGMQTFKLNIPIQIPQNINPSNEEGENLVKLQLAFFGPKGNSFGQVLDLQVRITENQEQLFKAAINLADINVGTFDECVEALKKFKGDENAACQYLLENSSFALAYKANGTPTQQ